MIAIIDLANSFERQLDEQCNRHPALGKLSFFYLLLTSIEESMNFIVTVVVVLSLNSS